MLLLLTAVSAAATERRLTIDVHARPWPYYTSIAQISDDIPITRYLGPRLSIEPAVPKPLVGQYAKLHHGHQPQVLPAWPVNRVEHVKLRPPVPRLYQLFDCVVHPAFNKASTRCNTLFCHSGEGLQKCLKIAATMERKGAFVAFFGQDTHLSAVKDEVFNISRAFSRSYYEPPASVEVTNAAVRDAFLPRVLEADVEGRPEDRQIFPPKLLLRGRVPAEQATNGPRRVDLSEQRIRPQTPVVHTGRVFGVAQRRNPAVHQR